MPKPGSDANTRIFVDELVRIAASRLKATSVIRLEDRWAHISSPSKPNSSAALIRSSRTAAHGPSSSAQNPAEGPKSFGSSMVHCFFSLFLSPTAR
jgi:hypothetical protein